MDTTPWQSKIVRYGWVATESILAHPQNFRVHPQVQQIALHSIISTVGLVQNIIINKRTSPEWPAGDRYVETLVDGAARVQLALREGQPTLPVTWVDLTPTEEALVLGSLDAIAALATVDRAQFQALQPDLVTDDTALLALFHDLAGTTPVPGDAGHPMRTPAPLPRQVPEVCCPHCGGVFTPGVG